MRLTALMTVLALVVGCKSDDTGDSDLVDLDGDGFADGTDCDDSDPTINPAANEICDGIDQDCNGTIDDGQRVTYYDDSDSDGFGDPDDSVDECSRPAGYVQDNTDCDDTRNDVNPVASELCDPVDHNCDGSNTEGANGNANFYLDSDGDGFGDESELLSACEAPAGYVSNPDNGNPDVNNDGFDCDDADTEVNPGATELCATSYDDNCNGIANGDEPLADGMDFAVDADFDGYGHETVVQEACGAGIPFDIDGDNVSDFVTVDNNDDCNDSDDSVNPNAPEICDGQDNDCDPSTDENEVGQDTVTWWLDTDGDGTGISTTSVNACTQPSGYAPTSVGEDCDDTNADISPLASEFCFDGIDNDCDTLTDDSSSADATLWFDDPDSDGFGTPGGTELVRCEQPSGYADNDFDCAPLDPNQGPPDPQFLDFDGDGYGDPMMEEISCDPITGYVDNGLDCDDNEISINPDTVWYLDGDMDGFGLDSTTVMECLQPVGYAGAGGDCDDSDPTFNPDAPDLCDGDDNDCDGMVDEDCTIEWCGLITEDTVWEDGFIHLITCDVLVAGSGGPVLSIDAGAEVRFDDGMRLRVGPAGAGTIQASGGADPIRFRHSDVINPGTWGGIEIGPSADPAAVSILSNVSIEDVSGIALTVDDVDMTLSNVSITGTDGPAISLEDDAVLTMTGSTIDGNQGAGIIAEDTARLDTFENNTITNNIGEPLFISAASLGELDNNNTYAGNTVPFIALLEGSITSDVTMALLDADYRVDGEIEVGGGGAPELTVADGVYVEFSAGTTLEVGVGARGALDVLGDTTGVEFRGTMDVEGHWEGLRFGELAEDSSLTGLSISNGGANGFGNIWIDGDTNVPADERVLLSLQDVVSTASDEAGLFARDVKLDVRDSTFSDNLSHGAEVLDVVFSESQILGNTFSTNVDSGVRISPHLVELVDGNTYSANGLPIEVISGTVSESALWLPQDEAYYITGVIDVENVAAPTLTLAAGTTLFHGPSGHIRIGDGNQGSINVQGPAPGGSEAPVLFTSITEYLGTTSVRGSYEGLTIGEGNRVSRLEGLTVRWGGANEGAIEIRGVGTQVVELSNVLVEQSGSAGLYAADPELWIHDSTFQDNDDVGVLLDPGASLFDAGGRSFTDNILTGNDLHGLQLSANSAGQIDPATTVLSGNQLQTGEPDRVAIYGSVLKSQTWTPLGPPALPVEYWLFAGDVNVGGQNRPTLTIEPGVRIVATAGTNYRFVVGELGTDGGIYAVGTPADPIVFTSGDDYLGAVPTHGDWGGVTLGADCIGSDSAQGHCVLDHVNIDYAGSFQEEAALMVHTRRNIPELFPVYLRNIRQRFSGSSGLQWQAISGVINPTPTPGFAPFIEVPPDLVIPYPFACEGFPDGSENAFAGCFVDPRVVDGHACYDSLNGTHGQTMLFCDNIESNVTSRNFAGSFIWRDCDDAGFDDGPTFCP